MGYGPSSRRCCKVQIFLRPLYLLTDDRVNEIMRAVFAGFAGHATVVPSLLHGLCRLESVGLTSHAERPTFAAAFVDVRADYFQHLSYSNLRMILKPSFLKQSDSKVASFKVFASIRFRQTQHIKVFWIHNQDVGVFATAKQVAINHQVNQKGLMVQAKEMSPGIWHEGWHCPTPFL